MNQNEKNARGRFKEAVLGRIHIESIENMISEATADAACINRNGKMFWVEFKHIVDWPKRVNTYPLKAAFKKGQLPFLKQWQSWNGTAFVALKAPDDWYLFKAKGNDGRDVNIDELNTEELKSIAIVVGLKEIIEYLIGLK